MRNGLWMALTLLAVGPMGGCGPTSGADVISDEEFSEVDLEPLSQEAVQPPAGAEPAEGAYVRLAWGYLAGRRDSPGPVNWSGHLSVDTGAVALQRLILFERGDRMEPAGKSDRLAWVSRTGPHFDGLVAKVVPSHPGAPVSLHTPPFSHDFPAAELANGVEKRFVVDSHGHEVSVSSLPASACGGFVFGYVKPVREGALAFSGHLIDAPGATRGVLQVREKGEVVHARVLGPNKERLARGTAKVHRNPQGGALEVSLTQENGAPFGTVTGLFHLDAGAPRGSLQATWRCE